MALSEDEVRHVAMLARLALTDDEVTQLAPQLSEILDYAETVSEATATDVEPLTHPFPLRNIMRDDEPRPSLPRDVILSQAPEAREDRFAVPRIVAEEG